MSSTPTHDAPDAVQGEKTLPINGTYWTSSRLTIHDWLHRQAPSLGELYYAAVVLVYGVPMPGRTRLIAHAVREIGNRLPDVLTGRQSAERLDYAKRVSKIAVTWDELGLDVQPGISTGMSVEPGTPSMTSTPDVAVPNELFLQVAGLIRDHQATSARVDDIARRIFQVGDPSADASPKRLAPIVNQWRKLIRWFVAHAHDSGKVDADFDEKTLRSKFELFESTLAALATPFFHVMREIEGILAQAEGPEHIVAKLGHTEHHRYLFDTLDRPDWVRPLMNLGFFTQPPAPIPDEDGRHVVFPAWPESRYLVRMVRQSPDDVFAAVQKIPSTDNFRVREDIIDIALALSPTQAATFVPKAREWIKSPYHALLPSKLGALMAYLAHEGETGPAFKIAEDLLALDRAATGDEAIGMIPGSTGVRTRYETWLYADIVRQRVPALVDADGLRALLLLCRLLDRVVQLSRHAQVGALQDDYSYLWRPAIEEHEQNIEDGVRSVLVDAVRDTAICLLHSSAIPIDQILSELDKRPWPIFGRIALHTLRIASEAETELVAVRLTSRATFDRLTYRHEYSLLLQASFGRLAPKAQATILGWIELGPDRVAYREAIERTLERTPSAQEVEEYVKHWQRDRLAPISKQLPDEWAQRYKVLVDDIGLPDHPDFPSYISGGWVGEGSPKSADELGLMGVTDLADYLKNWKPSEAFPEITQEGLALQVTALVTAQPEKVADEAIAFRDLDPIFVSAVLSGLNDALRQKKTFSWEGVLPLCMWVIQQPRGPREDDESSGTFRPDWGWARLQVAHLLSVGVNPGPMSIPSEMQNVVWEIVATLAADPDPTTADDAKYSSSMGPLTLSLNTVRGQAMHVVVGYGLWRRRCIVSSLGAEAQLARGFDEIPEVREVLNDHLNPNIDASPAIRSVIGQWFPQCALIDHEWAARNAERIFSDDLLGQAAWNAYVTMNQPYADIFSILEPYYRRAIGQLDVPYDDGREGDPHKGLVRHLMQLYWLGATRLEDPESLLVAFYTERCQVLDAYALEYVGRSLRHTKGDIPDPIIERLQRLWEWRIAAAKDATGSLLREYAQELASFGWWFASGKFDSRWSLAQLIDVLRLGVTVEDVDDVLDHLLVVYDTMPQEVVKCLEILVRDHVGDPRALFWMDRAIDVLVAVKSHADDTLGDIVNRIADDLGRRGYIRARAIVEAPPNSVAQDGEGY